MIFDKRVAEYVMAVAAAVGGTLLPEHFTDRCPECGCRLTYLDNDEHVIVVVDHGPPITVGVVVACEGYWMVDPALVGIDSPNWQSVAQIEADIAAAMGNCGDCGEAADHQHCVECGDAVYTLSTQGLCDGCVAEGAR